MAPRGKDLFMQKNSFIRAGLLALSCMAPTVGLGFTAADDATHSMNIGDSCSYYATIDSSEEHAYVEFFNLDVLDVFRAGGHYFNFNSLSTGNSITVSNLASCLRTPESNISGLTQDGPDGTFASDTYIGFSFTLATATSHLGAGAHTFNTDGHSFFFRRFQSSGFDCALCR